MDCLAAPLRQITLIDDGFSAERNFEVLHLYGKALRALQESIDDEEARMTAETLCAAELLGLFEVLMITHLSHTEESPLIYDQQCFSLLMVAHPHILGRVMLRA